MTRNLVTPTHHRTGSIFSILICALYLVVFQSDLCQAKFHVANDFSYTFNNITGKGKHQSSLTDGFTYLNMLMINGNGKVSGFDYHFNLGCRLTDDPRIDVQNFVLTNLHAGVTNKVHTFNVGDIFQSFSQYTLSTALKGASYTFFKSNSQLPQVKLIYGFANPRWDNFKGFGESEIKAIKREVIGGKISYSFSETFRAGLSVVRSDDSDRVNADDELNNILTCALDWEYMPIAGLTIEGESSYADASQSPAENEEDIDSVGYAHKIRAVGDGGPSRVTLEYERVSPDFRTVVGAATPDREKVKFSWRYKYDARHSITSKFLWYRDDLHHDKAFRTDHYKPEIRLTRKRMFGRRYGVSDISYKLDVTQQDDDTSRVDHYINLDYRDRFGKFDSDTNLGVTVYDFREAPEDKNVEYTYNTSLNGRFMVGNFILKPSLALGGWTFNRELEDTTDRLYEYALGLGVDIPKKRITTSLKIGQHKLDKEDGEDSLKGFARVSLYYRPQFLSRLNYGMLFLRAYVNDYQFDTASREFREISITAGINIRL